MPATETKMLEDSPVPGVLFFRVLISQPPPKKPSMCVARLTGIGQRGGDVHSDGRVWVLAVSLRHCHKQLHLVAQLVELRFGEGGRRCEKFEKKSIVLARPP